MTLGSHKIDNCHCHYVHNRKLHPMFKIWRLKCHKDAVQRTMIDSFGSYIREWN